jgi:hypothetical protein
MDCTAFRERLYSVELRVGRRVSSVHDSNPDPPDPTALIWYTKQMVVQAAQTEEQVYHGRLA